MIVQGVGVVPDFFFDWNPNLFVSYKPMQSLGTLRQLSLGDLADDGREEERGGGGENNA